MDQEKTYRTGRKRKTDPQERRRKPGEKLGPAKKTSLYWIRQMRHGRSVVIFCSGKSKRKPITGTCPGKWQKETMTFGERPMCKGKKCQRKREAKRKSGNEEDAPHREKLANEKRMKGAACCGERRNRKEGE